jgi:branched-chain amino acid transport system permease protein
VPDAAAATVAVSALLSVLLNGISYGLMLFMLAAGLTLILSLMGVLNFAHASFYMLGAYLGYQFSGWVGFWPASLLAPLTVGLLGALVERFGLRKVRPHGHLAELLFTFGLSYVMVELVSLIWGRAALPYGVPFALDGPVRWMQSFGLTFPRYRAFMAGIALLMLGALLVVVRSRIGLLLRAARTHPQQLEALGHNVPRLMTALFGCGCALAGLAGAVGGIAFITEPGMAASISAIVFVVVVLGGVGSLGGSLLAAVLLGVLDSFGKSIDASVGLGRLTLADLTPLLPLALLVAVLMLRPTGLLGPRED